MKSLFLSLIVLFVSSLLQARSITLSNDINRPAQYNNWDSAYAAANNGDTIYVAASYSTYGSPTLLKTLTIIGEGWGDSPTGGTRPGTPFDNIYIDSTSLGEGENCNLIGLYINNNISVTYSGINSVNIDLCYLYFGLQNFHGSTQPQANYIVKRSFLGGNVSVSNSSRLYITNCIVNGPLPLLSNSLVKNCLFFNTLITRSSYCTFENNIFIGCSALDSQNVFFSNFNNNLVNGGTLRLISPINATCAVSGNISVTPGFVNWNGSSTFNVRNNYRLTSGSIARNAGTDGTNLGPTGGLYNFYHQLGSYSPGPTITQFNIINNSVAPNGTLNIRVTSVSKN